MTESYSPRAIEAKWQERWMRNGIYRAVGDGKKPKYYFLLMFPYPSGRLHVGHWFMYVPPDAKARYLRMRGYDVMFPMGFDAFGLPAENAAIKRGIQPKEWTHSNIEEMRNSFRLMGASYDWSRAVVTCSPEYYRWTQWLFVQFYKQGLAYRKFAPVDWCPSCNTTLAREQVVGENRQCDRCDTPVVKRDLHQWLFRITKYADELLDFSGIEWPERVRTMQTNWIGRSEGAEVTFTAETGDDIVVFTTRADTLWGATFMVLAPEHPLVDTLTTDEQRDAVEAYKVASSRESEIDRLAVGKEKTGVFTGAYATNPVNGARIPIWIADYVLLSYGTGAIMAVPGHDERDFAFAARYDLPVVRVIAERVDQSAIPLAEPYCGDGLIVNSDFITGMTVQAGKARVTEWLEERGKGKVSVGFRLRDWLISRQRYWGAPIPIVYCDACGTVTVPEDQLPVMLPEQVEFLPTGESPLKLNEAFRTTTCPQCGGPAERDTDTMDTFVDSSWYWFRYCSPKEGERWANPEDLAKWLPVDQYAGGVEHATMHLLYARFFTKALADMGLVNHREPFLRLFNQGLMLGENGERMSKSRGNVVDPDDVVEKYGSDIFRTFLMFIGPWDKGGPWSSTGIEGIRRFFERLWAVFSGPPISGAAQTATAGDIDELQRKTHQTIARVEKGIDTFKCNTAIAALMELTNLMQRLKETDIRETPVWNEATHVLTLLLAPIAPHLAEELWSMRGETSSVHQQEWPRYDAALAQEQVVTVAIQVNGKVRDKVEMPAGTTEADATELALASPNVRRHLDGQSAKKVVYVPDRLLSIVV